ncbi:hypothetical protein KC364_g64 [Hortaea werneckii]|nr:hypothetical protein KC364_g64 [Hortaea werneckii]
MGVPCYAVPYWPLASHGSGGFLVPDVPYCVYVASHCSMTKPDGNLFHPIPLASQKEEDARPNFTVLGGGEISIFLVMYKRTFPRDKAQES